jgi:hypothetical protein
MPGKIPKTKPPKRATKPMPVVKKKKKKKKTKKGY